MHNIFERFQQLLNERFAHGVVTTEDSVRYTFFAALLESGVLPHQVTLEYPHPSITGAEIDTWLQSYQGGSVALEFKYDRDPPGGMNQPNTQKAGAVFKDLSRQVAAATHTGVRAYFVYVTTQAMATYFANARNGHAEFWSLTPGQRMRIEESYFEGKPKTFLSGLGPPFTAKLMGAYSADLNGRNFLRAYEVLSCER